MSTTTNVPLQPKITAIDADSQFVNQTWAADYLESFLGKGDPLADKIMDILYAEGRALALQSGNPADRPGPILQFLSLLINRMVIPDPESPHPFGEEDPNYKMSDDVRQALREFLAGARNLPAWVDFDLVRVGQKLFKDNPIIAYPLLAFLSLPVLYTCGRGGTEVLILTDQINTKVRRRVVETGALIMQVMQADSFTKLPEKSNLTNPVPIGIEGILRVRLLHAASRTVINEFWQDGLRDRAAEANKPADQPSKVRQYHGMSADQMWKKEFGLPINQQYLAGTLTTFSYIDLFGLEKLGVILSDEEKKGYMHVWNVFGYVLGIDEELLLRLDFPRTNQAVYENGAPVHAATGKEMETAGRALYTQLMKLNRSADAGAANGGQVLTKSLADYLGDVLKRRVPLGKYLPVERLPIVMMGLLLTDDDQKLLNIKTTLMDKLLFPVIILFFRLRGVVQKTNPLLVNTIANLFFHYMEQENSAVYDELEQKTGVRYSGIPLEFQQKWGLVK